MTGPAALQKLLTWLSPAFPVGAFAWSAGLETAIAERTVSDSAALQNWLEGALAHGGIRIDAILLAHAWRAEQTAPRSPSLPARGRVPAGDKLQIEPQPQSGTSPPAGEDGRGGATLSNLADLCLAPHAANALPASSPVCL